MASRKRFPIKGFFGGLTLGVGSGLMLTLYGQLILGEMTFMGVAGGLTVLGLILGIIGAPVGSGDREMDSDEEDSEAEEEWSESEESTEEDETDE